MLGGHAQLGRVIGAQDKAEGFAGAAVLSDGLWKRLYGGDSHVLGRQLRLDTDLYTVVGVIPPKFRHPGHMLQGAVEIWLTAGFRAAPFPKPPQSSARMIQGALGRLKPGLTVAQAQSKLDAFVAALTAQYPNEYPASARWAVRLTPLQEDLTGSAALLLAALGIYGVTAFWVQQRRQEIGIRIALGAPGGKVVAMVLRQGLAITLWGVAGGLAAAVPLARALRALLFGVGAFDLTTFLGIVLLLVAAACGACWLAARRATRVNPIEALRAD